MNIKSLATAMRKLVLRRRFSSSSYWENRYASAGNSGPGSYDHLAHFKASILNEFVHSHSIETVIEFGSGDGNQLKLSEYPQYTGYDVSPIAIRRCRELFKVDTTKNFSLVSEYDGRTADLTLSLDVIFHLTEDRVFEEYMRRLFDAATRFVAIYSSNEDKPAEIDAIHVRHRKFTAWVDRCAQPEWRLLEQVPNAYPYNGDYKSTSFSDFYIYKKV